MPDVRTIKAAAPSKVVTPAVAAKAKAPVAQPAAAPKADADALVRTAQPRRAPQPTNVKLGALEQMRTEKPKFRNPDEYKNYVIKFTGYIKSAKADMEVAQRALDAEKTKESEASAEFGKPLAAARKVLEDTHRLYQEPIDRINRDLGKAKQDLEDAIYPGKRKAAELDAEAARMARQISDFESDISSARHKIASLEGVIATELSRRNRAESDRSAAESEIRRLEPQAPSSSAHADQRNRTNQAASRLSEASSRLNEASSRLNRARDLERAVSQLESIDSQYDSAVDSRSSYKGHLTRKQRELDEAMASGDSARITAAKSAYDEMLGKYNAADQKVRALESQMSSYGASPSTINSVISSKRSELSQYAGAQSAYDRAASEKQSAQSAYDSEKSRLSAMDAIVDGLAAARKKRDDAASSISYADARIAASTSEKIQLNNTIYQLQSQLDTKTRERNSTVSEANRLRALQNPATHPQVVSAKARVDKLAGDLNAAQATYDQKITGPKAKVDEEQKTFNGKMRPFREKVADATRGVDQAKKAVDEVAAEFEKLKTSVGWWKQTWWKLWHHFDVKEFWENQGKAVALAFNQAHQALKQDIALA